MTNDEQYVPREANVRAAYVLAGIPDNASSDSIERAERRAGPEFDRFLARVRRDAAREALTRMAEDGKREGMRQFHLMTINAYRDQIYPEETP